MRGKYFRIEIWGVAWGVVLAVGLGAWADGGGEGALKVVDFEVRFSAVALMPNPGPRAECVCDGTGKLRVVLHGKEVKLELGVREAQLLGKAVEEFVRKPAPFVKRGRVLDGGLVEVYVRSATEARVCVIRNWRMPREGQVLFKAVRHAAEKARATEAQLQLIDSAGEVLMRVDNPDESDLEDAPVDVIANDGPDKLRDLLTNHRPRWMDDGEAEYLLKVLSKTKVEKVVERGQ